MKYISLLLAMTFITTSALGLPLGGPNSWNSLIVEYKSNLNSHQKMRAYTSENPAFLYNPQAIYSCLNEIENNLNTLNNLTDQDNMQAIQFCYNHMHQELGLSCIDCTSVNLEQLSEIKNSLIKAIKEEKLRIDRIIKEEKSRTERNRTIKKTVKILTATATLAGIAYIVKNQEALKNKTSELAARFLASDFASQAKKFGSKKYTQGAELFAKLSKGATNKYASFASSKAGKVAANAIWQVWSLPYTAKAAIDSLSIVPDFNITL